MPDEDIILTHLWVFFLLFLWYQIELCLFAIIGCSDLELKHFLRLQNTGIGKKSQIGSILTLNLIKMKC